MQKYHKFRWTKGLHNAIIDYVCKYNKRCLKNAKEKREGEELRPEINQILEGNFVSQNIVAEQKEEIIENDTTIEISEDKKTEEVSEYELWLKENNVIQGDD